jgi:hypothetical protein
MPTPAGSPSLAPALAAAAILAFLVPPASGAASRDERVQVLKSGRRSYDPLPPKPAPARPVQTPEQRRAENWRKADEAAAEAEARKARRTSNDETYDLPTVVVRPDTKPIKRLPRTDSYGPPRKDLKAEPYESATGRDARLVQRHLSKVEQVLIPLLGGSAVSTARGMEARQQKAAEMDNLATSLEIQEAAGRDPEDIKKLRAEYKRLHYSGPK